MSFISYANNLEDVMLWRAFRELDRGFYIDVCSGALASDTPPGSITRAFYQRGWVGLNITSDPAANQTLSSARPKDIHLHCVVGSPSIAQGDTLASVWSSCIPDNQSVHFLHIEAQGAEKNILSGNDWARLRPWVVLVTSTFGKGDANSHEDWEQLLLDQHYRFAYTDGRSRFYVAAEHEMLLQRFQYPPNILDDYMIESHQRAESALAETSLRLRAMETMYRQVLQQSIEARSMSDWAQAELIGCQAQLRAVQDSLSWRITSPVRRLQSMMRTWFGVDWKSRLKSSVKKPIVYLARQMLSHPEFKAWAVRLVTRLGVYDRFKSYLSGQSFFGGLGPNEPDAPSRYWVPTARSRRVHADLNAEIEKIRKENT